MAVTAAKVAAPSAHLGTCFVCVAPHMLVAFSLPLLGVVSFALLNVECFCFPGGGGGVVDVEIWSRCLALYGRRDLSNFTVDPMH